MITFILSFIMILMPLQEKTFKGKQLDHKRVSRAYEEKYRAFKNLLNEKNIAVEELEIFLRIYKAEGILELWGKEKSETEYRLLKVYSICSSSGHEGPKRREGDLQVPEGFYKINHFNPVSNFHLSLGINYPNASDRILSDKSHPGGSIYIHGSCVTIGCVPITDEGIKELYLAAVEAKNNSQQAIHVAIFPCRLEEASYRSLIAKHAGNQDYCNLWTDMKKEYDFFRQHHCRLSIIVMNNGRYKVE
jgi:murein L,D-transpeptidase YafK